MAFYRTQCSSSSVIKSKVECMYNSSLASTLDLNKEPMATTHSQ